MFAIHRTYNLVQSLKITYRLQSDTDITGVEYQDFHLNNHIHILASPVLRERERERGVA